MTTLITNGLIKLAKQAGFNLEFDDYVYEHWNSFQAFAELVAEAAASKEREACAKSLEDSAETATNFQAKVLIEWCATHIRARSQQ